MLNKFYSLVNTTDKIRTFSEVAMLYPLERERSVHRGIERLESDTFRTYPPGFNEYGDPREPPLTPFLPHSALRRKLLRAIAHYGAMQLSGEETAAKFGL